MLDRVKEFLRQEEKLRAGKINKIPIDFDLWKEKTSFAEMQMFEYTKFLSAISDKGSKKYSEYFQELDDTFGKRPGDPLGENKSSRGTSAKSSPEDDDPWLDEEVHIAVLKLFLNSEYEPPLKDQGAIALQLHLFVYEIYCKYVIPSLGCFYPIVNSYIDFAGMRLFDIAKAMTIAIHHKGSILDRTKSSTETTKRLIKIRQYRVVQHLLYLKKNDPAKLTGSLSKLADIVIEAIAPSPEEININIKGQNQKRLKIKCSHETIESDIRKSTLYSPKAAPAWIKKRTPVKS